MLTYADTRVCVCVCVCTCVSGVGGTKVGLTTTKTYDMLIEAFSVSGESLVFELCVCVCVPTVHADVC